MHARSEAGQAGFQKLFADWMQAYMALVVGPRIPFWVWVSLVASRPATEEGNAAPPRTQG
jgi:hypothetical protein